MVKTYNDDVILAGLDAYWIDDAGELQYIPNLTDIGELGETDEKKDKTNLSDTIMKYSSGLRDAPDKQLVGQDIPMQQGTSVYAEKYTQQQAFYKMARARREFTLVIKWKDDTSCSFRFKPLGFVMQSPNQAEWRMFQVDGSQNSVVLWDIDITGVSTLAPAGVAQMTAQAEQLDAYLGDGVITWSSSNEDVLTVSPTGEVTAVAAGEAYVMATLQGVTGVHKIEVA